MTQLQHFLADQFQEFISPEEWTEENQISEKISMLEATDIPISLLVAENDTICPASFVPSIMDSLGAKIKSAQYIEDFDHLSFVTANSDEYMQRVLSAIETRYIVPEEEGDGEDAEDGEDGEDTEDGEDDSDSDEEAVEGEVITDDDDWGECDGAHTLYLSTALITAAILAY